MGDKGNLRPSGDSPEVAEAKTKLRHAVIDLLQKGGSYFDIEESVSDAIVIQYNEFVYCDIHK